MFWAAGTEPHTVKACAAAALQVTPLGVYTEPPTVEPHTVLPAQLVHGLVGPEGERRGRENRACLGDRGGDAQAPGAASGERQAAHAAEQQREQDAFCSVFHHL